LAGLGAFSVERVEPAEGAGGAEGVAVVFM
jgi:hypothetical protein